ncbi:glutamate racemase [Treponema bryantii]|uniref:glutamate racemase n=1 Tax=Treponema bryantii TaxID=163 RepID=UPI002B2981AD|nr:glutamate racemase [Treponema bryantii]
MTDFVFIDSGVGGIPYMMKLLENKPESSCVYVADTANFPYGEKSHEQVVECVLELVGKIRTQFAPKVIVVACNTMSVNALDELRAKFSDIQFVGTVPAIKLAASVSKKRRIGLLATKATCENPYNLELKEKFAGDCVLVTRGDGELVSFIEHNAFTASREECLAAIKPAVDFFRKEDCDAVILGCTHFLNFTDVFEAACEPDIKVVDSVDGVVRHSLQLLAAAQAQPSPRLAKNSPPDCFYPADAGPLPKGSSSPSLFITGFRDTEEENQYNVLCSRFGIQFGGLLSK